MLHDMGCVSFLEVVNAQYEIVKPFHTVVCTIK